MKIFVGNLSGETTGDDLRQAFESFGQVRSVTIVMDTGASKSRGFGFVIMSSANEAKNAIEKINGKNLRGQKVYVEKSRTKAKTRSSRRKRSGSGAGGRANGGRSGDSGGRRGRRHH
jgi:RNA recognition motif-containing protein